MKRGLNISKGLNGRETALGPKLKDKLVKHILYLVQRVFIQTISGVRCLAF
jgi:hypothetical protein